jgi:hypothetical protein
LSDNTGWTKSNSILRRHFLDSEGRFTRKGSIDDPPLDYSERRRLYAKWKAKPENQQSTEDPAALKQRLYSEFEESNTGITILLIEPEEDEEDVPIPK